MNDRSEAEVCFAGSQSDAAEVFQIAKLILDQMPPLVRPFVD